MDNNREKLISFPTNLYRRLEKAWNDQPVRTKMLVIMGTALAIIGGIFAYLGISAVTSSTQQALQERVVIAQLAASHLDSTIDHIRAMMEGAAERIDLEEATKHDVPKGSDLTEVFVELSSIAQHVLLVDREGCLLDSWPPLASLSDFSIASLPSVQETLRTGQFRASGMVPLAEETGGSVLFSVPITDERGEVTGALIVVVDVTGEEFGGFLQPIVTSSAGYVDVVDRQGVVLISSEPDRQFLRTEHKGTLAEMVRSSGPLVGRCHDCHQSIQGSKPVPEVIAFAPLDRAEWGVLIRQSQEESLAPVRRLEFRLAVAAVAVLGVSLVLASLTAHSILQPLQRVTEAAERIAEGDLESSLHVERNDEFGRLLRTLDVMRGRLRDYVRQIQSHSEELERKVEERTAALKAAQVRALKARDYLQSVIDGLEDRLVVVDRSFRIQLANAAVRRRWTDGSPIGEHCWAVNHDGIPCPSTDCQCPVAMAFETKQAARVLHVHPNGEGGERYVSIIASPLCDELGEVREVVELMRDVTEEKQLEEQKEMLLHKVIVAQEEERRRLARELHDETGQALGALVIKSGALERSVPPEMDELRTGLAELRGLAAATLRSLRGLIHDLRPEILDDLGLEAAIRELAQERLDETGVRSEVRIESVGKLPPQSEVMLFRLIQEAVTNIARHAEATHATIEVHGTEERLLVTVEDDGVGFDPRRTMQDRECWGLRGMVERAALLGGVLHIESRPGEGTRIRIEIPLGGPR